MDPFQKNATGESNIVYSISMQYYKLSHGEITLVWDKTYHYTRFFSANR